MTEPKTLIQHYYGEYPVKDYWIVRILLNTVAGYERYVQNNGDSSVNRYRFSTEKEAQAVEKLFQKNIRIEESKMGTFAGKRDRNFETESHRLLMESLIKKKSADAMQQFETGATRNVAEDRLNYVRALSPIVLERYVQYLNAHRKQSDGSMRDFDNWKKGIPIDRYLEGLGRHFVAAWLLEQGFPAEDNRGPVTLEDTLCAIIFGASGWLHEIIQDKRSEKCGI